jgi:hypothetical protein
MTRSEMSTSVVIASELNGMRRSKNNDEYWTKIFAAIEAVAVFYKTKSREKLNDFFTKYDNPNLRKTMNALTVSLLGKVTEESYYVQILSEMRNSVEKVTIPFMDDALEAVLVCGQNTDKDELIIPPMEWMKNYINTKCDIETARLIKLIDEFEEVEDM